MLLAPKAWFNRAAETTGQMAFFRLSNWWLDRQIVNYFEPPGEWNPFTHTWSLGVEELTMARPGDVVLLASLRLPRLIHLGGETRQALDPTLGADVYSRTRAELQSLQAAVLDGPRWFEPFVTAGLRVVFELPKPVFRAHPFQCVDAITRTNPVCRGGLVEERQAQERYRAPVVSAIHTWTQAYPSVLAWDPLPVLCGATTCEAVRGGRPLFFDGDHISPYGNLVLLTSMREWIKELAP